MKNTQPREPVWIHDQGVIELFDAWRTIQGEGPLAGSVACFVRLSGCNLDCPLCDTDYTSKRKRVAPEELVEVVRAILPSGLVVLTGGEPFRQNLGVSVRLLLHAGYQVQIETNGTIFPEDHDWLNYVTIVCSPKVPGISQELRPYISAYKYVIQHGFVDPKDGLPTITLGYRRPSRPRTSRPWEHIYVQPLDEFNEGLNKLNLDATLESCYKFGYRLCLQMHKIIGLE